MVVKKKVKKKVSKISKNSFAKRKNKVLVNLIRSLVAFVIFLVLSLVVSNYVLDILFKLGALITGGISVAFILIFLGFLLYKKNSKKKR